MHKETESLQETEQAKIKRQFIEADKLHAKLFELWNNWSECENYDQFLYLTEFVRDSESYRNPLEQEIDYWSALISEFEKTGSWSKLNGY